MYHAGWAWAGSTPYQGTKLMGAYFGGTRQPMAVSWPKRIKADATPRPQFHHVIDIAPTIYELLGDHAAAHRERLRAGPDRWRQHGVRVRRRQGRRARARRSSSTSWQAAASITTAGSPARPARASRGSAAFPKGIKDWSPLTDDWELYNLDEDWSQANDLAAANPQKLDEDEGAVPGRIDAATRTCRSAAACGRPRCSIPEDAPATAAHRMDLRRPDDADAGIRRAEARQGGAASSRMDVDVPANANGVLYALAGFSGGVTCYVKDGVPQLRVQPVRGRAHEDHGRRRSCRRARRRSRSSRSSSTGSAAPMDVTLRVNGAGRGAGTRARRRCRCTSRRTRPSTSAATSIRPCRSTTSTRRRSRSTGRSARPASSYSEAVNFGTANPPPTAACAERGTKGHGWNVRSCVFACVSPRCCALLLLASRCSARAGRRRSRGRLRAAVPAGAVGEQGGPRAAGLRSQAPRRAEAPADGRAEHPDRAARRCRLRRCRTPSAARCTRRRSRGSPTRASATTRSTPPRSARRRAPRC